MAQQHLDQADGMAAEEDEAAREERELIQRLSQGDTTAFWGIWQLYQDNMFFRYCLRWMSGNYEDAEDALSNASMKAWKGFQISACDITNVKGWLVRLLHNHCIDMRRARERRVRSILLVEDIDGVSEKTAAVQESAEDVVLRREMNLCIHRAIDGLPPRLREPSRLRFFDELPYRDIASQLNLTPENVRKRLQQARALLQASLLAMVE